MPDRYRLPLILCHLDGLTRDEAAEHLGWSAGTIKGRLERGRQLLKRHLTRRGLTLSAGLLATLVAEPASAVQPELAQVTLRTLSHGSTSASVAALARDAMTGFGLRSSRIVVGVLIALGLALVANPITGGRQPPEKTEPGAAQRPAKDQPAPAVKPEPEKPIALRGKVVDPDDRPVSGAKIDAFRWNVAGGRRQVQTDADGKFTFELPARRPDEETWGGRLFAVAPGFAPAALNLSPELVKDEMTIRLSAAVPLEGRIITLEGQPVAGVEVKLVSINVYAPGDLDRCLKIAIEQGKRPIDTRVPYVFLAVEQYAGLLPELAKPVVTDRDGRFRFPHVGRDRLLVLDIKGPTIQHMELTAITRPGAPQRILTPDERDRYTILGSPFEHLARPARLIRGTIRAKDTGKPIAGAKVYSKGTTTGAVTDAEGRFEISGSPKGENYNVTVTPPEKSLFFLADRRVQDTAGLAPLTVDIDLLQGIPFTGRLLDPVTGKPVRGAVEYFPLAGNAVLNPKRDATGTFHHVAWRGVANNDQDGSYSLPVAPGPGVIAVQADGERYLEACIDPAEFFPGQNLDRSAWGDLRMLLTPMEGTGGLMRSQEDYRAIVPVNPSNKDAGIQHNIALTMARSIRARFIDPDGKPLTGVWTRGVASGPVVGRRFSGPLKDADFTIAGVNPKRPLTFYAVHEARDLTGQFTVTGNEKQSYLLKLQRGAVLTGRLVDRDGKPLAGVRMSASWSKPGENRYWPQNPPESPVTDDDGKFTIRWLIPDHEYLVGAVMPRSNSVDHVKAEIAPLKPGEKRDLGTLKFSPRPE